MTTNTSTKTKICTVLVIDNNPDCCKLVRQWLKTHSPEIEVFEIVLTADSAWTLDLIVNQIVSINPDVTTCDFWVDDTAGGCPDEIRSQFSSEIKAAVNAAGFKGEFYLTQGKDDTRDECFAAMSSKLSQLI